VLYILNAVDCVLYVVWCVWCVVCCVACMFDVSCAMFGVCRVLQPLCVVLYTMYRDCCTMCLLYRVCRAMHVFIWCVICVAYDAFCGVTLWCACGTLRVMHCTAVVVMQYCFFFVVVAFNVRCMLCVVMYVYVCFMHLCVFCVVHVSCRIMYHAGCVPYIACCMMCCMFEALCVRLSDYCVIYVVLCLCFVVLCTHDMYGGCHALYIVICVQHVVVCVLCVHGLYTTHCYVCIAFVLCYMRCVLFNILCMVCVLRGDACIVCCVLRCVSCVVLWVYYVDTFHIS